MTSAAQAFIVPVSGSGWNNNIVVDGERQPDNVNFNSVSADYFKTMGTPMLNGRDLRRTATRVASEKVGDRHRSVRAEVLPESESDRPDVPDRGRRPGSRGRTMHIVGVVKDTKYTDLREEFTPIAFFADVAGGRARLRACRSCCGPTAPLATITAEVSAAVAAVQPVDRHAVPDDGIAGARLAAARAADGDAVGLLRRPGRR